MTELQLTRKLELWDGKDTHYLENILIRDKLDKKIMTVISIMNKNGLAQQGASWILKSIVDDGLSLSKPQVNSIYSNINNLDSWQSKLHILQIMPSMTISKKVKKKVERFLRKTLTDQNKFVRAWSYNGFYELCLEYPEYQAEVTIFFEMAMRDEAASVKARIRNIMKKGFM